MWTRIAYHRVSDDSITSGVWDTRSEQTHNYIAELMMDGDIDLVWVRPEGNKNVVFLKGSDT